MKDEQRKATVRKLTNQINYLKDELAICYAEGNGKTDNKLDIDKIMNLIDRLTEIRKRLLY